MCNDVEAKGSKQIIINALSLYTLSMAFFLFSINYMVKFACKRHFRAFSLEIEIFLLPFYFEFPVLQECKWVFRELLPWSTNYCIIFIFIVYIWKSSYDFWIATNRIKTFRNMNGIFDLYPWFVVQKWLGKCLYDWSFLTKNHNCFTLLK